MPVDVLALHCLLYSVQIQSERVTSDEGHYPHMWVVIFVTQVCHCLARHLLLPLNCVEQRHVELGLVPIDRLADLRVKLLTLDFLQHILLCCKVVSLFLQFDLICRHAFVISDTDVTKVLGVTHLLEHPVHKLIGLLVVEAVREAGVQQEHNTPSVYDVLAQLRPDERVFIHSREEGKVFKCCLPAPVPAILVT